MSIVLLSLMLRLPALVPVAIDTPPRMPIELSQLSALKTEDDLRAATLLDNGQSAPIDLIVPRIANTREVLRFLIDNYPALLKAQSKTFTAYAWMHIDRAGAVSEMMMAKSSGDPDADALAMKVLRVVRFLPAVIHGDDVGVWVAYPLDIASYEWLQREIARGDRLPDEQYGTPTFTPYDVKPELRNRTQVGQELVRQYPPMLRAQGIGGTTLMWVLVDAKGVVAGVQVKESSGYSEIDAAAVRVARILRFAPAMNRNRAVPVWIALPIVFKTQ